jgi:4-phosphopantoate--beta-alanine ligase
MSSSDIPIDHPRYASLNARHLLEEGLKLGITTPTGLIAHGRGESLDYLLGEKTHPFAIEAMQATCARMLNAKKAVISINGNTAMLVAKEFCELADATGALLEVNLFYDAPGRREKIAEHFRKLGKEILGVIPDAKVQGLSSARANIDAKGIDTADFVLVSLEDGDRTEALIKNGKFVAAIDLNPLCRTAKMANITIVDNVTRVIPLMTKYCLKVLCSLSEAQRTEIYRRYNNQNNLVSAEKTLRNSDTY